MTPQKYQALKKAIQEAVPEIMELKFGCEVKVLFDDSDYYGKVPKEWIRTTIYEVSPRGTVIRVISKQINDIDVAKRTEAGELKILGRPIRLADVLLAITKNQVNKNLKNWYAISSGGTFLENSVKEITPRPYAHPMISTMVGWNLSDDNLDNQSDECKEFISKVLGV